METKETNTALQINSILEHYNFILVKYKDTDEIKSVLESNINIDKEDRMRYQYSYCDGTSNYDYHVEDFDKAYRDMESDFEEHFGIPYNEEYDSEWEENNYEVQIINYPKNDDHKAWYHDWDENYNYRATYIGWTTFDPYKGNQDTYFIWHSEDEELTYELVTDLSVYEQHLKDNGLYN